MREALRRWRRFVDLLGPSRREYAWVALATALLGAVSGFVHPLLIKAIFDEAASRSNLPHLLLLALGYLLLCLGTNAGAYACSLWQQRLDNRIVARVSSDLLHAYYRMSYREVLRDGAGSYVSRIRSDVKEGLVPMLAGVRTICGQAVTFVALVSALLLISWQAFVVLMVLIPIATAMSVGVSRRIRELTGTEREREAELVGVLGKAVAAFKLVCTFGMAGPTAAAHDRRLEAALSSAYRRFKVVRTLQAASDVTMVVSDACSILVGALFVFRKQMTLGSFIAFMNAFWRSATTLIALFKSWAELQSYAATVDRIDAFLRTAPTPVAQERTESAQLHAADIAFGYGEEAIFRNFSIMLRSGERALIVGANGSGKTTLANVLAGYLEPSAGRVMRPARISAVTLPLLFPPLKVHELGADGALLQSLGVGGEEIAQAYPDELSAGQQQKIALALALSRDADLYVLDEPTANLDPASRALAMELISDRTQGRMLLLIMHGADEHSSLFDQVLYMTPSGTARLHAAEVGALAAADMR